MRYGEMRTAFNSVMESLQIPVGIFDFAESIDDALYFIALNLPPDALADHISVYYTDVNSTTPRQVGLPGDYMKAESVRLAKQRDASDNPIYLPSVIVSPREFSNKSQYSQSAVASFFNGMLSYNPDLPVEVENKKGPIELIYRKKPRGFIKNYSDKAPAALVTLDQDPSNSRLLTTETAAQSWADLGLETENLFGGQIIIPVGGTVIIGKIDYAWDDSGGVFSGLHVSEKSLIGTISATIANIYVIEKLPVYTGSETIFESDTSEPDLPDAYHHIALNYAIGKFLLARKPEIGNAYMGLVAQTFRSMGIMMKIEFGGEENV